ncbi:MAG: hypothetical protein J2P57_00870 [Acidimicrobiaceae bacterium]|nr:hypothetical protein [Acidimicrobiaceae bacterium]
MEPLPGSSAAIGTDAASRWGSLRVPRSDLGRLDPFDQGGEGVLYRVRGVTGPYRRPMLYKEYRADRASVLDSEALQWLPRFARSLDPNTQAWLYQRAAWPAWVVDDPERSDQAVGVLMPLAPPRFMIELPRSSGGRRLVPAKFELLLNGSRFLDSLGIDISMPQRIRLLSSVAETLAFLHAHNIAVGDFSCKNLLFSLRPGAASFTIDCDSMSHGGRAALPPGETPEWELPDGEQLATCSADVYKFALLALRMHTGAQHHRVASRLPDGTWGPLRALIERTLSSPPAQRPLITDWTGPLQAAAAAAPPRLAAPARPHRVAPHRPLPPPLEAPRADPQLPEGLPGWLVRFLQWLLIRKPAAPSASKLLSAVLGLWALCAGAFGLAVLAGMDPRHMTRLDEIGLFGAFALFALIAFGFATTEPG